MSSRRSLRPLALAAPVVSIAVLAVATACLDSRKVTEPELDAWADQTLVGLQVNADLRTRDASGFSTVSSSIHQANFALMHVAKVVNAAGSRAPGAATRHTVIRHMRDSVGNIRSLALYYADPSAPPTFVYAFENGHIRAIDARSYRRHGTGFVRSKSRVTVFGDSGRPIAQLDLTPQQVAGTSPGSGASRIWTAALAVARDVAVVALPSPLYAEEFESCTTEWWAWTAASGMVALTTSALATAVAACPATAGVTCAAAVEAGIKLTGAIAAWSYALDKYIECTERAKGVQSGGSATGSGGGGGTGGSGRPDDSIYADTEDSVQGFVDKAISSGNFWCSSNGNDCVYYAAE